MPQIHPDILAHGVGLPPRPHRVLHRTAPRDRGAPRGRRPGRAGPAVLRARARQTRATPSLPQISPCWSAPRAAAPCPRSASVSLPRLLLFPCPRRLSPVRLRCRARCPPETMPSSPLATPAAPHPLLPPSHRILHYLVFTSPSKSKRPKP